MADDAVSLHFCARAWKVTKVVSFKVPKKCSQKSNSRKIIVQRRKEKAKNVFYSCLSTPQCLEFTSIVAISIGTFFLSESFQHCDGKAVFCSSFPDDSKCLMLFLFGYPTYFLLTVLHFWSAGGRTDVKQKNPLFHDKCPFDSLGILHQNLITQRYCLFFVAQNMTVESKHHYLLLWYWHQHHSHHTKYYFPSPFEDVTGLEKYLRKLKHHGFTALGNFIPLIKESSAHHHSFHFFSYLF